MTDINILHVAVFTSRSFKSSVGFRPYVIFQVAVRTWLLYRTFVLTPVVCLAVVCRGETRLDQLRILTPLLDWKRCTSFKSYTFSVISFVPFAPSVPLVPSRIRSKFSEVCGCSFRLVILLKTSSKLYCLLNAVSQSVLFTEILISSTSRRLINFECCRVCPWTSL